MKQTPFFTLFLLSTAALLTQCSTPTDNASGESLPSATKDAPFVNSLGMKFVPVPGTDVLFCTTETTLAQYQAAGLGYQSPQFPQGSNHPAVNVSWNDAKAWCAWLSKVEGRKYRLPTDAEWSAAVGPTTYPWGNQWPPPNNAGNYAGQEMRGCTEADRAMLFRGLMGFTLIGGFSDHHKFTAPVGNYQANIYGLHDMGGNVWEWCADKHRHAQMSDRVLRGGSYYLAKRDRLASSRRYFGSQDIRLGEYGFRCVLER